jgi:hypothetical protein
MHIISDEAHKLRNLDDQTKTRYYKSGLLPARVGTMHVYRCDDGHVEHLTVADLSVVRPDPSTVVWVCQSEHCDSKKWPTKAELVAAHEPVIELQKRWEAHVYHAVANVPAAEAQAAVRDRKGNTIRSYVPAREAGISLLSDEE